MNYEEKYNEILEWARKNKARLNGVPIEEVLPELAESEDESMEDEILKFFCHCIEEEHIYVPTRFFDWIKKQKEKKPAEWSEDERIRKALVEYFAPPVSFTTVRGIPVQKVRDWLEKQKEENHNGKKWLTPEELHRIEQLRYEAGFDAGVRSEAEKRKSNFDTHWENGSMVCERKERSWKPTEEEMGVLYKLCYVSAQISDDDDTELTRLYQDLKREYFNGHSFENMFPKTEKEQEPIKMEVHEVGKGTTVCGQDYKCKKDYQAGNCRYIKDAIYHCGRDGYLTDQNGVSWSCTPEWFNEYIYTNNELDEEEKNRFVSGQFLQCKLSFDGFKEGEHYWLEYVGDNTYVGRSDNILNQKFHITPRQLFTLFSQQLEEVQGPPQEEKQVSLNYEPPFNENPSDIEIIDALIHSLNEQDGFLTAIDCVSTKAILRWLEKQKEQKPADLSEMMVHKEPYISPVSTPMVADEQKSAEWAELQSEFKNINEAFEDGKKEVVANPEKYGLCEQKPIEQLGDTFTSYDMAKTFTEGQNYVIAHPEKFGLCKPAEWKEEDKGMLNCIIATLCEESHGGREANEKMVTWLKNRLKSLRPQPKQEWSKEDENKIERLAFLVSVAEEKEMISPSESIDLRNLIKSFYPRPKQERQIKEGDKVSIHCRKDREKHIIAVYDGKVGKVTHVSDKKYPWGHIAVKLDNGCNNSFHEDELEVLDEPHWKPSDEQMSALEECGECKRCVKELREQIKKL